MPEMLTIKVNQTAVATVNLLDDQEHLVVPVVAIKEGVLNEIFYPADEIASFAEAWNGVPVPVNHPTEGGKFISANSPHVENIFNIGKLYNVKFVDNSLKGEIWINIKKAIKLGFDSVVNSLKEGEMMEVSTGMFLEKKMESGVFNNKAYTAVAKNIRPDHLALLPETNGACSIKDGCGAMRVNEAKPCCGSCGEKQAMNMRQKINDAIKLVGKKLGFISNELSFEDISRQLYKILDAKRTGDIYPYIVDVFDDSFVFDLGGSLNKQSYIIKNGLVEIVGESEKVSLMKEYKPVTGNNLATNTTEGAKMPNDKLVAELIANATNQFTADEQAQLAGLSEELLTKVKSLSANKSEGKQITEAEFAEYQVFKANEAKRIEDLKKKVLEANKKLTKEIVDTMPTAAIEALVLQDAEKTEVDNVTNFAARGGAVSTNKADEPYVRPKVLTAVNN